MANSAINDFISVSGIHSDGWGFTGLTLEGLCSGVLNFSFKFHWFLEGTKDPFAFIMFMNLTLLS